MAKTLRSLANSYEVKDFFSYIVQVWINGNKNQALQLFKEMAQDDRKDFMIELNNCTFKKYGDGPWQIEFLDYLIRNSIIR